MSTYAFGNHFRLQFACFLLHYFLVVISLTYTSANLLKPENSVFHLFRKNARYILVIQKCVIIHVFHFLILGTVHFILGINNSCFNKFIIVVVVNVNIIWRIIDCEDLFFITMSLFDSLSAQNKVIIPFQKLMFQILLSE